MSAGRAQQSVIESSAFGEALGGAVPDGLLATALLSIVLLAEAAIELADGASVSLLVANRLTTVASSNEIVAGMDADQYRLGEGPCISAATTGVRFRIDSVARETRWPQFSASAADRGISAVLSNPLTVRGAPVGALNICSRTAWAFALPHSALASVLAGQVSAMLAARAAEARRAEELGHAMQGVLAGRRTVVLAQGILMERHGCSADEAHALLRQYSRTSGSGLVSAAHRIVGSVGRALLRAPGQD